MFRLILLFFCIINQFAASDKQKSLCLLHRIFSYCYQIYAFPSAGFVAKYRRWIQTRRKCSMKRYYMQIAAVIAIVMVACTVLPLVIDSMSAHAVARYYETTTVDTVRSNS